MSTALASKSASQQTDTLGQFRELCVQYSGLVKKEGVEIRPYFAEEMPFFAKKPAEVQRHAIATIQADISIFESMLAEGQSLKDTRKHLWRFLNHMKVVPQSDVFDKIEDEDTVEVYFLEKDGQRQMFRNLRFLECISLSIEELYGIDWKVATEHDARYEQDIGTGIYQVMTSAVPATYHFDSAPHIVQEIGSPGLYKLSIQMKMLSPLVHQGNIIAIIATNRSQILSKAF